MSELVDFIRKHTERGACCCGRCFDGPPNPRLHQPLGHTADVVFFKVRAIGSPNPDTLCALISAHHGYDGEIVPLNGKEHSFLQIGGWIGDQGLALTLMGLGSLLGIWELITPRSIASMVGKTLPEHIVQSAAGLGYVFVKAKAKAKAKGS